MVTIDQGRIAVMWEFSILRTLGLVLRTWPFTVLRLIVFFGFIAAYVVAVSVGAGLGWGVGHVGSRDFLANATAVGGIVGFVGVSIWAWWLREYLTYMITAGHVAALTLAFDGRPLPAGRGQVGFALDTVKARFVEIHALFVLDQAVKATVGVVTRSVDWVAGLVDMPGLQGLAQLVGSILRMSTTFVDEIVLARGLRDGAENPWDNARSSLVLYAQNAGPILVAAVWLTVLRWVLTIVLFVLMVGPAGALVWFVPGAASGWVLIFALAMAVALQKALIDPFCIAALMQVYFARIEGQRPDPTWEARLDELSTAFRSLADRARGWLGGAVSAH